MSKFVSMEPIRVMVVDDDALVRRALSLFFAGVADVVVVDTAKDGVEAVDLAMMHRPDVIIMDVHMPNMDGVIATERILAEHPQMRILAVTALGSYDAVLPMLRAGASGYLLKDSEPEDVIAGVRQVHAGMTIVSPAVTKRLIGAVLSNASEPIARFSPGMELTGRELAIVKELAHGRSNPEIGARLNVSEGTVKACLSTVMRKWNARDRLQVLIFAVRAGLIDV